MHVLLEPSGIRLSQRLALSKGATVLSPRFGRPSVEIQAEYLYSSSCVDFLGVLDKLSPTR
jgi:hypothetical protein